MLVIDPTNRSRLEALFRRDTLARLLAVELADARERSRTRRTASYLIEVAPESDPAALVASFQAMAYRTDRWHLGPRDWSAEWKAEH